MEKKENNIAKNTSSGAEKVENISERAQVKAETMGESSPKVVTKKETVTIKKSGKKEKKAAKNKEEKEKAAAKKRVDAAIAKEQRKAKKAELKAARKAKQEEKRLQMKAKREEHRAKMKEKRAQAKAERLARRELLRSETAAQRMERIEKERAEKLALKKREQAYNLKLEKRDARLKKREQKLKDKQHRRETRRTPGFGGWLAAVISLGVVTLAMTAVVTLGAINMSEMNGAMAGTYRGTLYELVGIMENVNTDLNKVRVSASTVQQSRLLTDLLVQTRLAESSLERFPIDSHSDANVTSFINRTADASQELLNKLGNGGKLTESDLARLEKLYQTNHKVREELNRLALEMTDKDMQAFMKEKKGNRVFESFQTLENATLEENKEESGPFAEQSAENKEGAEQEKKDEISSSRAEELCLEYFKDYSIVSTGYAGETISGDMQAYNFFLLDDHERQLFAQIAKNGGALISFDFYENCTEKNFDVERSKAIAEEYLAGLGYENMTAVWVNESGTQITFNFAYEQSGTVYYPDMVKVKVCETKGKVVGFDAVAFLKNHRSRSVPNTKISLGEAREKLNKNLSVDASRLAVIPVDGKEIAAYEFVCTYGEEDTYFIYVDANTGNEVRILNVLNSKQGRVLI